MIKKIAFLLLIGTSVFAQKNNKYPVAPQCDNIDHYYDTLVHDPYQWMEDSQDERLGDWLKGQRRVNAKQERNQVGMSPFIRQLISMQNNVEATTFEDSISFEKTKNNSKYQIDRITNSNTKTPDVTYRLRDKGLYKTLAKASDFKDEDKSYIHFGSLIISEKLDIAALPVQRDGGDWREIHFYDLTTNTKLPEVLYNMRSTQLFWGQDGVYYSKFDKPEDGLELLSFFTGQCFCYHKFGEHIEKDSVLYSHPDKSGASTYTAWTIDSLNIGIVSHVYSGKKVLRSIGFANILSPDSFQLKNILYLPNDDNIEIKIAAIIDDKLIIRTNWNAPNGQVLVSNISQPNNISKLIPEFDVNLVSISQFGEDKLVGMYRHEGRYSAVFFNLAGEMLYKQDFDEGKMVNYLYETRDSVDYTTFCVSSYCHPDLWYQIALNDFKITPIQSVSVPYDPAALETRYVEYPSKDGTLVPMYITCQKGIKMNGKNPVKMYAYGGYGKIVEPDYDPWDALWVLHGGILAVPNVRGGGANGSSWAQDGRGVNKQNCIDDFNAAAEYLINQKYTNSDKIVTEGASHGGMLVAAAAIQRPDLYKAVIAVNGALDMLRFEKFTVGGAHSNKVEFGVTSNPDEFKSLCNYSPMHCIKDGVKYPNILLITGEKDHRVPPIHSYKFLATLQAKADPSSLYQMYLVKNAGHDLYKNNSDYVDYLLFKYYFMYHQVGLKY